MLDLWFGLDASGFDHSVEFHPLFGPVLVVTYACLSNTLLLTVLVSILSNTFATINEDAAAEALFRKAVWTIEGVKADALFSYQPPVNLLALCIMFPAGYLLSPRWFHKVNVFVIRLTNFPILLMIALYERQSKKWETTGFLETIVATVESSIPRQLKRLTIFEGLIGYGADIDAIFEVQDCESTLEYDEFEDRRGNPRPCGISQGFLAPLSTHGHPVTNNPTAKSHSLYGSDSVPYAPSPLARLYQPSVLDRIIPEESPNIVPSNPMTTLVSYGPSSRRRLHSLQSGRSQYSEHCAQQPRPVPLRKSTTLPDHTCGTSYGRQTLSRSPEEIPQPEVNLLETDSRPSELVEMSGKSTKSESWMEDSSQDPWLTRLDRLERRQERIESLLQQIAKHIKDQ